MRYAVSSGDTTIVSGPATLTALNPAAAPSYNIRFLRFWVGQQDSTTSAQQPIVIANKASAFPTVTAATPRLLHNAGAASVIAGGTAGAAGTCGVDASAEGAGTQTDMIPDVFNVVSGYLLVLSPDEQITYVAGSNACLIMKLVTTAPQVDGWSFGFAFDQT
jgi:hypothetical protein